METILEMPKILEMFSIHLHPIPFRLFPILIQWCQVPPQLPSAPAPVEARRSSRRGPVMPCVASKVVVFEQKKQKRIYITVINCWYVLFFEVYICLYWHLRTSGHMTWYRDIQSAIRSTWSSGKIQETLIRAGPTLLWCVFGFLRVIL